MNRGAFPDAPRGFSERACRTGAVVQDCYAGADDTYRLPVRIITEYAWHSLFARHMFINDAAAPAESTHVPEFTVISLPSFKADPARHATNGSTVIALHFGKKLVLIGGTSYAGEIKKSSSRFSITCCR